MRISKLSIARWYDPVLSISIATFLLFYFARTTVTSSFAVLLIVLAVTVPAFLIECFRSEWFLKYFRQKEKMPRIQKGFWEQIFVKWLGVLAGTLLILFLLWLLPDYRLPKYFLPLSEVKYFVAGLVLLVGLPLIAVTDRVLGSKLDATYEFGKIFLGKWRNLDLEKIKDVLREWILRGFFLVLNYTTAVSMFTNFKTTGGFINYVSFAQFAPIFLELIFLVLLFTILPGYLFSSRLINTEVKNVDRTMLGWVVTFICYPPVIYSVFTAWLDYKVNLEHSLMEPWLQILGSLPTLLISVGVIIILLELVHLWGEALLGLRSSNLMNRGIVTNGPFTYTKHPIYVVKCIGWFLVYLPFINPSGFLSAFQSTILLLGVCYVFLARGWAEERLLASDEVYVAYARYIDKQGVFAWLGRLLPILSFTWRYEYWERKGLLKL